MPCYVGNFLLKIKMNKVYLLKLLIVISIYLLLFLHLLQIYLNNCWIKILILDSLLIKLNNIIGLKISLLNINLFLMIFKIQFISKYLKRIFFKIFRKKKFWNIWKKMLKINIQLFFYWKWSKFLSLTL